MCVYVSVQSASHYAKELWELYIHIAIVSQWTTEHTGKHIHIQLRNGTFVDSIKKNRIDLNFLVPDWLAKKRQQQQENISKNPNKHCSHCSHSPIDEWQGDKNTYIHTNTLSQSDLLLGSRWVCLIERIYIYIVCVFPSIHTFGTIESLGAQRSFYQCRMSRSVLLLSVFGCFNNVSDQWISCLLSGGVCVCDFVLHCYFLKIY